MTTVCQPGVRRRTPSATGTVLWIITILLLASLPAATQVSDDGRPRVEPPDGVWQVDEEGLRYFVHEIAKGIEGKHWVWVDENRIRLYGGLVLEVVDHDETSFKVKIYEILPLTPQAASEAPSAEARQENLPRRGALEAIALERFDDGLPRRGQWRQGFSVADVNGDDHPDLVFGSARKQGRARPNIFLGDGAGHWRLWSEASYPGLAYDYGDVETADLDGDGHVDLALAMHVSGLAVLRGDGQGRFEAWNEGLPSLDENEGRSGHFSARALELADVNDDGRVDLIALSEGFAAVAQRVPGDGAPAPTTQGVRLYLNRGEGRWEEKVVTTAGFGDSITLLSVAGSERPGILRSAGRFGDKELLVLPGEGGGWRSNTLSSLPDDAWVRAVAAGDVRTDGTSELIVGYATRGSSGWITGVDVLSRTDDGWQGEVIHSEEGRAGVTAVAVGNLDGRGSPDLAVGTGDGRIWILLDNGEGAFTRHELQGLPGPREGCVVYEVGLWDFDGDLRDELIAALAGEPGTSSSGDPRGCPGGGSLRVWRWADVAGAASR